MSEEVKALALWAKIVLGIFLALVALGVLSQIAQTTGDEKYFVLGELTATTFIPLCIGWYCGNFNVRRAMKIKKNINLAFLLGFFFSLLGLLIYYIYYRHYFNKLSEKEKRVFQPVYTCPSCKQKFKLDEDNSWRVKHFEKIKGRCPYCATHLILGQKKATFLCEK